MFQSLHSKYFVELRQNQSSRVHDRSLDLPTTLEDLLNSCNMLLDFNITVEDLAQYCVPRSGRQSSLIIQEITSVGQVTSAGGSKPLNKFEYTDLSLENRPEFLSFDIDEARLEAMVKSKILLPDFDNILKDLILKLTQLRSILYSIKKLSLVRTTAVWSELTVQCMLMLFLNYTFAALGSHIQARAANTLQINLIDGSLKTWKGMTDLTCAHKEEVSIEKAVATLELKVPFNQSNSTLYESKAVRPKQQLLGQAMGLRQMSKGHSPTYHLSYLTDIFALSVMYHVERKACLSTRVSDAKAFCLRLLLMCCGLNRDELESLIPAVMTNVDLEEEDDAESPTLKNPDTSNPLADQSDASVRSVTRSQTKYDGDHRKRGISFGTFGDEEEEAHEQRLADIADVLRWEAKCLGYVYLGIEEMRGHNISAQHYK